MMSIFADTMALDKWTEMEEYGRKGAKVLFPIGVIEEHGPHISLASDISWSHAMCRRVKEKLRESGCESIIAPPYYWGVNQCTGAFPGSFSLKPETMQQVLLETFQNLKAFGFEEVYCFNYHGDAAHIKAILEAVKRADTESGMRVRLLMEAMDVEIYGLTEWKEFLLVIDPDYPVEWFAEGKPEEQGLFDIHAGAFETAVLHYFCEEQVDLEKASALPSSSLDEDGMRKWLQGGEVTKRALPLGYAGDPAGYTAVEKHVEEMIALQVAEICRRIIAENGREWHGSGKDRESPLRYEKLDGKNFSVNSLDHFVRHQQVTECWRKQDGEWKLVPMAFEENWSVEQCREIAADVALHMEKDQTAIGAFDGEELVGFITVSHNIFGNTAKYVELVCFQVSEPYRGRGIGKALFRRACEAAKQSGAEKMYISAQSSKESQAAYKALGCVHAAEINRKLAEEEPCDVQLEYVLG